MTNGPDDILELGYKLDISHFRFTEQELSLYELYSIFSSFIKVEETITRQQTEKNRRKQNHFKIKFRNFIKFNFY